MFIRFIIIVKNWKHVSVNCCHSCLLTPSACKHFWAWSTSPRLIAETAVGSMKSLPGIHPYVGRDWRLFEGVMLKTWSQHWQNREGVWCLTDPLNVETRRNDRQANIQCITGLPFLLPLQQSSLWSLHASSSPQQIPLGPSVQPTPRHLQKVYCHL